MKPDHIKKLIAYLAVASSDWSGCVSHDKTPLQVARILAGATSEAYAPGRPLTMSRADIEGIVPEPLKVLSGCITLIDQLYDWPDLFESEAWDVLYELQALAAERLPGFNRFDWPLSTSLP